ncbi:MAG: hypothetical protein AB1491_11340 [Thermodesulfobacteriota bacterium]
MGRQLRKLNFLIEEEVCRDLERLVPPGKRSQIVNAALRKELEMLRREQAGGRILAHRITGRKFSNRQIAEELAKDRSVH